MLGQHSTARTVEHGLGLRSSIYARELTCYHLCPCWQFLGIWLALSITPVLFFVVWTLGSIAIVTGIAITISFSILAFLIGTAGLLLLGTLAFTLFLALVGTFWLAVAVGAYRLLFAITNEPTLPEAIAVSPQLSTLACTMFRGLSREIQSQAEN